MTLKKETQTPLRSEESKLWRKERLSRPPWEDPKVDPLSVQTFLETERQKQNWAHISMSEPLKCSSLCATYAVNSSVVPNTLFSSPSPQTQHIWCPQTHVSPQTHFPANTLPCLFCSYNEECLQNASSPCPNYKGIKFCLRTTFLFQILTWKKLEYFKVGMSIKSLLLFTDDTICEYCKSYCLMKLEEISCIVYS